MSIKFMNMLELKRDEVHEMIGNLLAGHCPFVEFPYCSEEERELLESLVRVDALYRGVKLYRTVKDDRVRVVCSVKGLP